MKNTTAALPILFFSLQAFAFTIISFDGKPTRWDKSEITYIMDTKGSQDFSRGCDQSGGRCESERTAMQKAFAAWARVEGVRVPIRELSPSSVGDTGYDGKNEVTFVDTGWSSLSFRPPAAALAVTITTYRLDDSKIVDADIHFNGQYFTWGVINTDAEKTGGDVVDIQAVGTHEVGHFLGLGHSSEDYYEPTYDLFTATMYYASGPGNTDPRVLKADDIAGIRHLYPQDDPGNPEVDAVSPEDIDARVVNSATITVTGANFDGSTSVLLVRNGDRGDVAGRITSRSSDTLEVSFPTYGLGSGSYDVLVANAYNAQTRVKDAIQLTTYGDQEDDGQYGSMNGDQSAGCAAGGSGNFAHFLLMVGLPFLLIFPGRLQGVVLRIRNQRIRRNHR